MRFSVVVPVYNVAEYLGKCLDSVLPALEEEDEVILSLGRSEDKSSEIAVEYAGKYANVQIVWQRGKGLSDARNCALEVVTGDYVICVDSDDYVDTVMLRELLERMRREEWQEDVIAHDFRRLERKTDKLVNVFQIGAGVEGFGLDFLPQMLRRRQCFWNVWRFIYKREFLEENGIRYLDNVMSEDVAYTADVLVAKPSMRFVHYPFYVYTVGKGDSLMDKPTHKRIEDTVYVLTYAVEKILGSDLAAKSCVAAQFQFEYLLNMALCWEIDKSDRLAAIELFKDWREVLADSLDRLVKASRLVLGILGVKIFGWGLHKLKLVRRWLRRFR